MVHTSWHSASQILLLELKAQEMCEQPDRAGREKDIGRVCKLKQSWGAGSQGGWGGLDGAASRALLMTRVRRTDVGSEGEEADWRKDGK